MKKLFSFVAMALLSATTFATQYCQEPLEATDGTALLSMKHVSGNTYAVELVAQGGMKFTSAYNINCGVNQTVGAGIGFAKEKFVISADGLTATYEFETGSAESVPTTLYGNYMCFVKQGGTTTRDLVEFHLDAIVDIDWTTTCAAGPEDTEAPEMGEANFASATYTSITLNVSATDNVAVKRYHVVTTGVDKDIFPSNGQIVITGLTAGTTYTIDVTAKDAAGNESANKVTVSNVKTLSHPAAPTAPMHSQDKVCSIYSDAYTSTVTRVTGGWGQQTKEQEVALAEGDNAFFYTNCNYLGWELNGNTTIGDMSLFPKLHMDIYVPEAGSIQFTPIYGGHETLKEYSLVQGWNALDIDLVADFASINLKNIYQLKWDAMPAVCFIDNVYFWTNGTSTAVDAQEVATKVSKMIENGQVVIIREGVKYDVTGRAIGR